MLNQHKTKEIDYQKRRKKIKNKKNRIEQKIKWDKDELKKKLSWMKARDLKIKRGKGYLRRFGNYFQEC